MAAVLAVAGPAHAASADELKVHALANSLRASVGAPAVTYDETLASVARAWASKMAASGTISHNPDLPKQVSNWIRVTENVGMGPNIETIHNALVASPSHYANLVDREVTIMGVGVVVSGNTVFLVQNFMKPSGTATAGAPATTTPTTKAPVAATTPTTKAPVAATTPTTAPATSADPAGTATGASAGSTDSLAPYLNIVIELTLSWV